MNHRSFHRAVFAPAGDSVRVMARRRKPKPASRTRKPGSWKLPHPHVNLRSLGRPFAALVGVAGLTKAETLKAVFSHNIRWPEQKPEQGQYLGDPQQPENKHTDEASRRDADKRYAAIKDRLVGVYVPA